VASRQPILLSDEVVPPPALIRAGLDALPSIIRAQGERASRRFIEFFTANIRNADFMAGRLRFDIPGQPGAQIINEGFISVRDGVYTIRSVTLGTIAVQQSDIRTLTNGAPAPATSSPACSAR
jgi:hypothetical protein